MPRRLLDNSVFDPETTQTMANAFAEVWAVVEKPRQIEAARPPL